MNGMIQKNNIINNNPSQLFSTHGITMSFLYKGLVLSEIIQPLHLGHDYGVFQASGQNFLGGIKEVVYLHGSDYSQTIRAWIEEVNPNRAWITLTHFTPLNSNWRDRKEDRVQPSSPIHVRLFCFNHHCLGSLDNVSGQGLGVLVYHLQEMGFRSGEGTRVQVDIPSQCELPAIKLEALLQSIRNIGTTQVKLGLRVYPNRKQMLLLRQYIETRKREIVMELNNAKYSRLEPRGTKDLYF